MQSDADRPATARHGASTPVAQPGAVLVVDDESFLRDALVRGLSRHQLQAVGAADGEEALACVQKGEVPVAAVLLDLTMPGMGGAGAARALAQIAPQLPVLLMTGYSRESAEPLLTLPNVVGLLEKPFSIANLVDRLRDMVSGSGHQP